MKSSGSNTTCVVPSRYGTTFFKSHAAMVGLLPVPRIPSLDVMMKSKTANGKENFQSGFKLEAGVDALSVEVSAKGQVKRLEQGEGPNIVPKGFNARKAMTEQNRSPS
jgi:hypothetical protein